MKSTFVLLSLVALSQADVPKTIALDGRIINGEAARLGEIPYQVSLQDYGSHFCGGSILNKNYVITTAHCVSGVIMNHIKVVAGTIDLEEPKSIHKVIKIFIHEDYNPRNVLFNDIALVKVAEEFQVSETISFVPLPESNHHVPIHAIAVISGWGDTKVGGSRSKNLLRTELQILDQSYCSKVYAPLGYIIHDSQICANTSTVVTGPCYGDQGSPLTVDGKIIGISSWFTGCTQLKYPSVYTRVTDYIDWIKNNSN